MFRSKVKMFHIITWNDIYLQLNQIPTNHRHYFTIVVLLTVKINYFLYSLILYVSIL